MATVVWLTRGSVQEDIIEMTHAAVTDSMLSNCVKVRRPPFPSIIKYRSLSRERISYKTDYKSHQTKIPNNKLDSAAVCMNFARRKDCRGYGFNQLLRGNLRW